MAYLRRLKGAYDHLAQAPNPNLNPYPNPNPNPTPNPNPNPTQALPLVAREANGSTNERAVMQLAGLGF